MDWKFLQEMCRASMFLFLVSAVRHILLNWDDVYFDKNMHDSNYLSITYKSWLLCWNSGCHLSNEVQQKKLPVVKLIHSMTFILQILVKYHFFNDLL